MQNNMNNTYDQFGSDEVSSELSERLAEYLEGLNTGQTVPVALMDGDEEWTRLTGLLQTPRRMTLAAATLPVESAWQSFRMRAFEVKPALQPEVQAQDNSLGSYVAQALAANEQATLNESGLPKNTLEAFQVDATPLAQLKGYKLDDYAALAKRYGIKDNLFPRMLKWLKGLGKNLALPASQLGGRGMVFARDEEARRQGVHEAQLAEDLARETGSVTEAAEEDKGQE